MSSLIKYPKCANLISGSAGLPGSSIADPNHNSLLEYLEQPLLVRSDDFHTDALSLFDDLELEKPKGKIISHQFVFVCISNSCLFIQA